MYESSSFSIPLSTHVIVCVFIIDIIVGVKGHPSHFKHESVEDQRVHVTCIASCVAELGSGQQISLTRNLMLVPIRPNVLSLQH